MISSGTVGKMSNSLEDIKNNYQVVLENNDEFIVNDENFFNNLKHDRYYINKIDSNNCSTTYLFLYKPQSSSKNKKQTTAYIPEKVAFVKGDTLFSNTNLPEISENFFALAQAYHLKNLNKSLDFFKQACNGENQDQAYISWMHLGTLAKDFDEAIRHFIKAWEINKNRAESLWLAAIECRKKEYWELAYSFAKTAAGIPMPAHGLLVQKNCYEWGAIDELAIAAYWTGRYQEARNQIYRLIDHIPETEFERIKKNIDLIEGKLKCNKDRPRVISDIATQSAKVIAKLAIDAKSILVISDNTSAMQLVKQYASPKAEIVGITTSKKHAVEISDILEKLNLKCPNLILHSEFVMEYTANDNRFDLIFADHSSPLFSEMFWHLWDASSRKGKILLTNELFRSYDSWSLILDDIKAIKPNYLDSDYTLVTRKSLWKLKSNHGLEAWECGKGEPPATPFE